MKAYRIGPAAVVFKGHFYRIERSRFPRFVRVAKLSISRELSTEIKCNDSNIKQTNNSSKKSPPKKSHKAEAEDGKASTSK